MVIQTKRQSTIVHPPETLSKIPKQTATNCMSSQMSSNERLCDIFTMLVSRLDTIEDKLNSIQLHERHKDALRPFGETFSAVALTGECVALTVFGHRHFDENGDFQLLPVDDNVFVLEGIFEGTSMYNMPWHDGGGMWEWKQYVVDVLGEDVYQRVVTTLRNIDESDDPPSCQEMGIESSCGELHAEFIDIAMRRCIPELLAIASQYLVVKASSVQDAMSLATQVRHYLKMDPMERLSMFHIPSRLVPLALAVVRGKGHKEEFNRLGEGQRNELLSCAEGRKWSGMYHTSQFFNSSNLFRCVL